MPIFRDTLSLLQLDNLQNFLFVEEYEIILLTMRYYVCFCITVWGFVLTPGLCQAGVLEHLCQGCAEHSSETHEDECASDPCALFLREPGTMRLDLVPIDIPGDVLGLMAPMCFSNVPVEVAGLFEGACRVNIPYHSSDVPLLA
jgi:hypothetical protein